MSGLMVFETVFGATEKTGLKLTKKQPPDGFGVCRSRLHQRKPVSAEPRWPNVLFTEVARLGAGCRL
jgi:hypothetical protein